MIVDCSRRLPYHSPMAKVDAPVVTKALLKHDMEELRDYCGPEIMQRLEGLCKAFQQQVGEMEGRFQLVARMST